MRRILEGFTPYDRSVRWRLHDAYFTARGLAAWREGDIPQQATSNYGVAQQHAAVLGALVASGEGASSRPGEGASSRPPDRPLRVLEVGAGSGAFAANLLRALHDEPTCEPARAGGVRYLLTDGASRSVREALALPELAPWVERGSVEPGVLDLHRPGELGGLDDAEAAPESGLLDAVVANYVCCVTPAKQLRFGPDGVEELEIELAVEPEPGEPQEPERWLAHALERPEEPGLMRRIEPRHRWRPTRLDALFDEPLHRAVVSRMARGRDGATLVYPWPFVELLVALADRLAPHGALWTSDVGSPDPPCGSDGRTAYIPLDYGNTLNLEVDFGLFDALAAELGWGVLRTRDPLAGLQTAILLPGGPPSRGVEEAFRRHYLERHAGDELLDLATAAACLESAEEPVPAVRLWRMALARDPNNAGILYRLGRACIEAGHVALALEPLERGLVTRVVPGDPDCEFQLGRACFMLGRPEEAADWYRRSLAHDEDPTARSNLGNALEAAGRPQEARRAHERALALDPEHEAARQALRRLG